MKFTLWLGFFFLLIIALIYYPRETTLDKTKKLEVNVCGDYTAIDAYSKHKSNKVIVLCSDNLVRWYEH
jgi:hypothetical protein